MEPSLRRPGAVTYMRIPATRPGELARFYEEVFGWSIRGEGQSRGFTDASGYLIGHFVTDQAITGEDGFRPYIYVDSVAETLALLSVRGGQVLIAPYAEGNLTVATFEDPDGNVVGVWQAPPG